MSAPRANHQRAPVAAAAARRRGFTLLELLVVVGLIAGLSFALLAGLSGGGKGMALQAAQTTVANLVTVARTRAVASGRSARLLFHADARSGPRYRRWIVLQEETDAGDWATRDFSVLPEGVFVLPHRGQIPAGLYASGVAWTDAAGEPLESSVLFAPPVSVAVEGDGPEAWNALTFTAAGTIAGSGHLVLAPGRQRPPGAVPAGEAPVQLEQPEAVRGLALSAYGLPRMVNERAGF